jgi:hypothetical protein
MEYLSGMSRELDLPLFRVVERVADLQVPETQFGIAKKLTKLVLVVRNLRQSASEVRSTNQSK